ncbi:hypothetical protein [Nostoc sp. UHCC 0251]|uniref:hypothetical protein n=1 Tax=Nostoc sp. UHCC 0251 TaxID=3110240 RepID=UPI002B1FC196|nr:hypothetical protein [Nostoc sp. UHCC 0251]MEA5622218.1 hypothetical protein [Nostoc sp. UHCC 0251]
MYEREGKAKKPQSENKRVSEIIRRVEAEGSEPTTEVEVTIITHKKEGYLNGGPLNIVKTKILNEAKLSYGEKIEVVEREVILTEKNMKDAGNYAIKQYIDSKEFVWERRTILFLEANLTYSGATQFPWKVTDLPDTENYLILFFTSTYGWDEEGKGKVTHLAGDKGTLPTEQQLELKKVVAKKEVLGVKEVPEWINHYSKVKQKINAWLEY